jgi:hypothetical protein
MASSLHRFPLVIAGTQSGWRLGKAIISPFHSFGKIKRLEASQ